MAGHVEFGDDGDPAVRGVAEDFDEIGLGVVAVAQGGLVVAVRSDAVGGHQGVGLADGAVLVQDRDAAVGAVGGELRQTVEFHAPAFVITQVQMQAVHLVMVEQGDEFQEVILRGEVTAHVQHDAAVAHVGPVLDDGVRDSRAARVPLEIVDGDGGVVGAVLIGRLHLHLAVQRDAVPAGGLAFDGFGLHVRRNDRRPFRLFHLLQPGDHVERVRGDRGPVEELDRLGGQERIVRIDRDGFLAFLLQVEAFGGAEAVHERPGLIAEDEGFSLRVRIRGHPVQGAAEVLDPRFTFQDGDGSAELAEPESPLRTLGRILDFQGVDGLAGFGICGSLGPNYVTRLRARERERKHKE